MNKQTISVELAFRRGGNAMILKSLIKQLSIGIAFGGAAILPTSGFAGLDCPVNYANLKSALESARLAEPSGLGTNVWATFVNRDGIVCAVAFTGEPGDQWPSGRVTSAQKANTANAFSLLHLALSTANLYQTFQPGSYFFGENTPVNANVAYAGDPGNYGTSKDPMVGEIIGGVIGVGGGLALYNAEPRLVGALGVSGDTSCADHFVAWRARHNLGLDYVPSGVSGDSSRPDNIIFDITPNPNGGTGLSAGGFGHPTCTNTGNEATLPIVSK
jgi:uncharacterized protein GlcG (DUF336 family)